MVGGVDWKQVKDSVKQVLAAIDDAFGISDNLYRSMEALQNAFSHFADMSGELKDGLYDRWEGFGNSALYLW